MQHPPDDPPFVAQFALANWSNATLKLYTDRFRRFGNWCDVNGLVALPAESATVRRFLTDIVGTSRANTVRAYRTAIAFHHHRAGHHFDSLEFSGVTRRVPWTTQPPWKTAYPVDPQLLRTICATLPATPIGLRDRALFTVGFAAALRPSEIRFLDYGDATPSGRGVLRTTPDGLFIHLHKAKTDQDGDGLVKFLAAGGDPCSATAMHDWLGWRGDMIGALFGACSAKAALGPRIGSASVTRRLRRAIARCTDLSDAERSTLQRHVTGHSLRSGFVTAAVAAGIDVPAIVDHVGWKSYEHLLKYTRFNREQSERVTRAVFGRRAT